MFISPQCRINWKRPKKFWSKLSESYFFQWKFIYYSEKYQLTVKEFTPVRLYGNEFAVSDDEIQQTIISPEEFLGLSNTENITPPISNHDVSEISNDDSFTLKSVIPTSASADNPKNQKTKSQTLK